MMLGLFLLRSSQPPRKPRRLFSECEMDIKLIEPVTEYSKTFKTVDEFNLFYTKNKADIDAQTTHMLNKLYYIDGYRIAKTKGTLALKKYDDTQKRYFSRRDEQDLRDKEIVRLDKEIAEIRESVNKIIKYLNPDAE